MESLIQLLCAVFAPLLNIIPGATAERLHLFCLRHRMTRKDQIYFLQNYAKLITDGFMIIEALTILKREYQQTLGQDCTEVGFCNEALRMMGDDGVLSLSEAMGSWFNPVFIQVISVSTTSKNTSQALDELLKNFDRWEEVRKELMGIAKTPVLWIVGAVSLASSVSIYGLPLLGGDKFTEKMTPLTEYFYHYGVWVERNGNLILLLLLAGILSYLYVLFNVNGDVRRTLDTRVPGFGLYQAFQAANFYTIMAVLVSPKGGCLKLKEALEAFEDNSDICSDYLETHVTEMFRKAEMEGMSDMEQLNTGLLPLKMKIRLGVAGKTKNGLTMVTTFQSISQHLAEDYRDQLKHRVKRIFNLIMVFSVSLGVASILAMLDAAFSRIDSSML